MRLVNANIKNFKSFKNVDLNLNEKKTLIIGKNNCGKSNFLEVLEKLLNIGEGLRDIPSFLPELDKQEYYFDTSQPIEISLSFKLERGTKGCPEKISKYVDEREGSFFLDVFFRKKIGETGDFFVGDTSLNHPEYVKTARFIYLNCVVAGTSRDYYNNLKDNTSSLYSRILRLIMRNILDREKNKILKNRDKEETEFKRILFGEIEEKLGVDLLRRFFPNLKGINFSVKGEIKSEILEVLDRKREVMEKDLEKIISSVDIILNDGKAQSLSMKGMGIQSIFLVNLMLEINDFFDFNPLVCIDEAELHLHPQAQRMFNKALEKLAQKNQIIVTTHSPIFVSNMDLENVILFKKNESTESYKLSGRDVPLENIKKELNEFNSEMIFANSVLLVEGKSEELFFRYLANQCMDESFNLDRNNISVIPVHGKNNMKTYVSILKEFQIPYVIVMDRDGQSSAKQILSEKDVSLKSFKDETQRIEYLKNHNIFILKKGEIEDYYPDELIKRQFNNNKKIIDNLKDKEKQITTENFKILENTIINNLPISKPQTRQEESRLKKNIEKWYDREIIRLRGEGLVSMKKKKKHEIYESIFGNIGKPRIALKICEIINGRDINEPELKEIIERVVEFSKNS